MPSTDKPARLLFFLGPHFGVLFLKKIAGYSAGLTYKVVTYSGESDAYYGYENVSDHCKKNRIECLNSSANSEEEVSEVYASYDPTMILCGYYAKILPVEILKLAKGGAFNVHPGKLPGYRGSFPTAWAILNNEHEIGITIHEMDRGVDTGPIVAQKNYAISPDETGYALYRRSMELSAEFLFSFLPNLLKKNYKSVDQATLGTGSHYGRMASHCPIDWKDSASRIRNLVRVHSKPYFPAYSFMKNKMVLVNRCEIANRRTMKLQAPGTILDAPPGRAFYVSCGDGVIEVTDYEVCPLDADGRKEEFIKKGAVLY